MTASLEKFPRYSLKRLSNEAADQLVRYLYLMIDDIQFQRDDGLGSLEADVVPSSEEEQIPFEYNDQIPF